MAASVKISIDSGLAVLVIVPSPVDAAPLAKHSSRECSPGGASSASIGIGQAQRAQPRPGLVADLSDADLQRHGMHAVLHARQQASQRLASKEKKEQHERLRMECSAAACAFDHDIVEARRLQIISLGDCHGGRATCLLSHAVEQHFVGGCSTPFGIKPKTAPVELAAASCPLSLWFDPQCGSPHMGHRQAQSPHAEEPRQGAAEQHRA
eukprot:1887856-Prymnesium_polylepis.2